MKIARKVARVRRDLHGHFWTFGSFVRGVVRPEPVPTDRAFRTTLRDPISGDVEVTGRLAEPAAGARDLVVVLHGLGGDVGSRYVLIAARTALESGLAVLRLHLRGADLGGADVYHAALTADLDAALASPELARFERVFVLGYSLGGHVALHWAASAHEAGGAIDPGRVRAVAAICPPVDLSAGVRAIQRLDRRPYQFHVMRGLKDQYAAVAARHGEGSRVAPARVRDVRAFRTIVEWDSQVIAPRYGFDGAEDYYARASIAPRLPSIRIPTLIVSATADPMIPPSTVRPGLSVASDALRVVYLRRGGHVGFPSDVRLRLGTEIEGPGVEREALRWLASHR